MHAGGVHHDAGMHRFGNVALRAFDMKNEALAPHRVDGSGPGDALGYGLDGIGGRSLCGLDVYNFA